MADVQHQSAQQDHVLRQENMLDLVAAVFTSHRRSAPETIMDMRSLEH